MFFLRVDARENQMFWAPQIFFNLISTMDHFLCKFHILFQLKKLLFIGLYFRARHHFTPRPSPSPIQIHTEKTCQQFHTIPTEEILGVQLHLHWTHN